MVLLRVTLVLKDKRPNLEPLLVLHVPPVVMHQMPIALHVKLVSLVLLVHRFATLVPKAHLLQLQGLHCALPAQLASFPSSLRVIFVQLVSSLLQ